MNVSRKQFLSWIGIGTAAASLPGCIRVPKAIVGGNPRIALQLYSLNRYIGGTKDESGKVVIPGVGLEKTLENVAAIGYCGVEFAGYYGFGARDIRRMLMAAGLVPCGTHVNTLAYGLDTKTWTYDSESLKRTCDFNMSFGNNLIICPGGGNIPPGVAPTAGRGGKASEPSQAIDEFIEKLLESYNRIAEDAAKMGCRIGLHNHTWEHAIFLRNGTSFWDYFFSNTCDNICMEQDVGWTTCAGDFIPGVNPMVQYAKYPHRSPTLHAKENGMGKGVEKFDAILGKPGCDEKGVVCATPVDWDGLIPVARRDGVQWFVVECERHFEDLSAVMPSYNFLKSKGLN